ncbi:KamA family protein [Kibdelosporangium banguiense]|uniref:KamA family protein n=1 Tax=Kibdelosporangium banguiense TaxID=1365924 RepID=A0ABS4TN34_9PSEU|nr:lysine 2,3-aminomutase [Kibdelosporangium banguiense]MBP2325812.1 KamA family protein [Kibdelosporangium banguiense]
MTLLADGLTDTARFRAYGPRHIDAVAERFGLPAEICSTIKAIARVLPFRVNEYVLNELVDWHNIPDDPIFRMVFPQRGMLSPADEFRLAALGADPGMKVALRQAVKEIRDGLNPHPSGQRQLNVPTVDGVRIPGLQHKYLQTVLYFPAQGQTCHSYCTYCFRWAQFVGDADLRFAAPNPDGLIAYLKRHPHVSDVLVTGGDPMVMSTERLRSHLRPILDVESVSTIRIGTKSVAYWPYRFVTDRDADDVLRLFEEVVAAGRTLAVMAHFSHPRELETAVARQAIARIRSTGAVVYCQGPMIAHVNDDAPTWSELWRRELAVGAVPYYMFVERDTGPHEYFKVPLARAVEIFHAAYRTLPGLARTVRGPVMSATPGKVVVDGVEETPAGRFFQLRMLQARNPALAGRPFRARYSTSASWLTELRIDRSAPPDITAAVAGTGVQGTPALTGQG